LPLSHLYLHTRCLYLSVDIYITLKNNKQAPSFDQHLNEDHNLWTYVHYISYLKKKDPTEDSGIESYVRQQLSDLSMEWIPTRTSYFLESYFKAKGTTQQSALQEKKYKETPDHSPTTSPQTPSSSTPSSTS